MSEGAITTSNFMPLSFGVPGDSGAIGQIGDLVQRGQRRISSRGNPTAGEQAKPIRGSNMAVDDEAGPVLARPAAAPQIRARLFELMKCCIDDGDPVPSQESHRGLMGFIAHVADARMPLLAADDDGLLVATWRRGQHSMLSIRFLDESKIEFAISRETRPGKVARDWGETDWKSFLERTPLARDFAAGAS
jgi:hypothetical protein